MQQYTSNAPSSEQRWGPLRIAGIYLLMGGLWILFSDKFAASLTQDPLLLTKISLYKGWGYILVTALLLYAMIQQYSIQLRAGEQDLRASEARFSTIFRNNPVGICISQLENAVIEEANEAFLKLFGYVREEVLQHNSNELAMWVDTSRRAQLVEDLREGQKITNIEVMIRRKSGEVREVLLSSEIVSINHEELLLSIVTDITERKRFEEELASQRDFAMQVMNTMGQGLTVTNETLAFEYVNPAYAKMVGATPDELMGRNPAEFGFPEEYPILYEALEARLNGETTHYEVHLRQKNGDARPVLITGVPRWHKGKVMGSISVITDLTERKRIEETLAQQSKNLGTLYELGQEITASLELPHIYAAAHRAATRLIPGEIFVISLLCEDVNEIEDVYLWDQDRLWPGERYPAGQDLTGHIISHGQPLRVNEWDSSYDDLTQATVFGYSEQDVHALLAVPMFRTGGTCFGMMSIQTYEVQTYTSEHEQLLTMLANQVAKAIENAQLYLQVQQELNERKRAEEEIRYQAHLLDNVSDVIVSTDLKFHIKSWNKAAENIYGWRVEEVLGKVSWDIVPTSFVDSSYDEAKVALLEKGFWQGALQQQSQDGTERIFLCSTTLLYDLEGHPCNLVFVNRDLTDSIKHQQEVEAIGRVSAALRTASTRVEMIPIILDQIEALFKAEATAFTAVDHRTNETVVEAARGGLAKALRMRLPVREGISGHVLATQTPYLNNQVFPNDFFPGANELMEAQAVVCLPLIAHHQTIGTLWLARNPALTEHDVHILVAVADIAANALYRAGLFEQTQQQLERLAILHAIDEAIASSFDVRPTLFVLLDQIHTRLKLSAADVYLYNPYNYLLEFAAGNGFQGQGIKYTRLRLGEIFTGQTALDRKIVAISAFQTYLSENPHPVSQLLQAEGFETYFGIPLISKGQIKGVLELFHREPMAPDEDWLEFLNTLSRQVAIAIDNVEMLEGVQRSKLELELAYDATIEGWSRVLDLRDKETEGHSQRVTELTIRLARELSVPEAEIVHIRRGALLHDIGKMGIPDAILLKPNKLTPEEWDVMRQHPSLAYEMLSSIAYLKPALDIPLYHHEKWDGTGYPHGLKGEQIPLAARIFALSDVWDALTSNRPYRRSAWSVSETLAYIQEQAGLYFDPKIVEVFMRSQAPDLSQQERDQLSYNRN